MRLTEEAYEQGALLSHEDLACLLSSSLATIKRDVGQLRQQGLNVPTRGQVKDIGKRVSHKSQIVQDYLAGYTFSEIECRRRHSTGAIGRYCQDFRLNGNPGGKPSRKLKFTAYPFIVGVYRHQISFREGDLGQPPEIQKSRLFPLSLQQPKKSPLIGGDFSSTNFWCQFYYPYAFENG